MSGATALLATTLATTAALMLVLWCVSLWRRDASIVDIFWGLGFVQIATVACWLGDGWELRRALVLTLTALWGLRLSAYLAWRNLGKGEDFRYRAMRKSHGDRFAWVSLYTVFGMQGVLMWIVSLPIQAAALASTPARFTGFDVVGVALFAAGLCFEAIGDWQLARFKAEPANRGRVMDRGLWAWTRHPNYFGDSLVWWGLFAVALATPGGVLTLVGPLLMTGLLLRVSGVALLERTLVRTRPEYRDYIERTSAFFPRPPRPRPR